MVQVKKQHYIPRFYLKNFTFDLEQQIFFCYDKISGKSYKCNIKDVAHQNKFYESQYLLPNEIENNMSYFEANRWAPSLAKLIQKKNFKQLSYKEKKDIFHFLALQHIRTPRDMQSTLELHNAIARKAKEVYSQQSTMDVIESEEDKQELYLSTIYGKDIDTTIEVKIGNFVKRRWNILINTNPANSLCTSDNPFALGNSLGSYESAYSNPGAIIYFPLTNNELLCSFDPKFEIRNNKDVLKMKEIHYANIAQIVSANRFIFQKTNDFAYADEFLKRFPVYRNFQPRYEVKLDGK